MALTTISPALQDTQAQYTGFKNRLINGQMQIDQRNAGASTSWASGTSGYTLDRWVAYNNGTNTFTVQQSSTAPAGFSKSFLVTNGTATGATSTMYQLIGQRIEGNNIADLAWGTGSAKSVTVSFWVYTSQAGTYGGVIRNSGSNNRFYGFSFTLPATTWTYVTATVPGDTSGSYATDNTNSIELLLCLSCGSSYVGSAGSWSGSQILGITGQTQFNATASATFYITGVQLEKGSTATSFDYRPYGTELALCQRYLPCYAGFGQIPGCGNYYSTSQSLISISFPVQTRVAPSGVTVNNAAYLNTGCAGVSADVALSSIGFNQATTLGALLQTTQSSTSSLAVGSPSTLRGNNSGMIMYFTGCEL